MEALRRGIRISGACVFLVYFTGLVYALFFAEGYGRGAGSAVYRCNLIPFREIGRYVAHWRILGPRYVALNLAGNVAGFLPFGALVPLFARGTRRAWKAALLSFEVSVLVEISQLLFRVGCCDVDDVILNTVGGLLGFAVFRIGCAVYAGAERRRRIGDRNDEATKTGILF